MNHKTDVFTERDLEALILRHEELKLAVETVPNDAYLKLCLEACELHLNFRLSEMDATSKK